MKQEISGDVIDLVNKTNIISDKLAFFKSNNSNFRYKIKLTIGKVSKLCLYTERMNF